MDNAKRKILIVDDSPDDLRVLMENLKDKYAVVAATSGARALEMAGQDDAVDVILLDVSMPDMDGYETCRQLKSFDALQYTDVIFVSSHDTVEEKLAGYDAGGSDYLIKPVEVEELLKKVELAITNKDKRIEFSKDKHDAMQAALTAITSAGEYGNVIEFMRKSFEVKTIEDLAALIIGSIKEFGTDCSVQVRNRFGDVNQSSRNPIAPLEIELLTRLKDQNRIMEQGKRAIFNFGNISMLVINMPEDADRRGRLRDHYAILLEAAEARLKSLVKDLTISNLLRTSNDALSDIKAMQSMQKEQAVSIMDGVMQELEAAFLSYGLTEEQEDMLMKVVQNGVDKSLENFEQGLIIDEKMNNLISGLRSIFH